MPNHKSAEKRLRQSQRRRIRNRRVKTAVRTAIKKVRSSATGGDSASAQQDFVAAEKLLASAAAKGVINRKSAARRIARLARALKKGRAAA